MNQQAHAPANELLVKKSIVVAASPERAFDVFTKQMTAWWPIASHKIGKADMKEAVIEPRVGGRWFERGVDGSECDWGHVRVWDPPGRLTLTWEITADWQSDPNLITEVDVRFIREGSQTRVELEHRMLEAFGARAVEMKGVFDSEGGWTGLLASFAKRASAS
jgi:uncharacterized protein YndB with AHSA1/START domain